MSTEAQLIEAKNAYHMLLTGRSVVSVFKNGQRVEYKSTTKHNLQAYIEELEATIKSNGSFKRRLPPAGVC